MKRILNFTKHNNDIELSPEKRERSEVIVHKMEEELSKSYSEEKIVKAEKKAVENYGGKKTLSKIWKKILVLFEIAKRPKVWGLGVAIPASVAVLYLVLPLDAIPDIIVGAGLIDDIFVITTLIATIIKTVSTFTREKIEKLREDIPPSLLETFDEMFPRKEDNDTSKGDKTPKEDSIENIEKTVAEAKKNISCLHSFLDRKAEKFSFIKKTKLYRTLDKIDRSTDRIVTSSILLASKALSSYLNLSLLKKTIKSLISFSFFFLSLLFYYLGDLSRFFLILSSLFMLLSYGFLIHFTLRAVITLYYFIKGYRKGDIEEGVVYVLFHRSEKDPKLKEILVRVGVKRVKNNPEILRVLFKNFQATLLSFICKIILIIISFFLLKRMALSLSGIDSGLRLVVLPIMELFSLS